MWSIGSGSAIEQRSNGFPEVRSLCKGLGETAGPAERSRAEGIGNMRSVQTGGEKSDRQFGQDQGQGPAPCRGLSFWRGGLVVFCCKDVG